VFHIDSSRGSIVLENILGKDFAGKISSDFFSAYRKFARLSSALPQYCWAHLIRECTLDLRTAREKCDGILEILYGRFDSWAFAAEIAEGLILNDSPFSKTLR
jgi:hypothetical protein